MKNKTLKEGLALLGIGAAVVALALHPPRLLCRIYLAMEKAAAVFLGVMLALAGIAALLGLTEQPSDEKPPVAYTIDYD